MWGLMNEAVGGERMEMGREKWKERMKGGEIAASLAIVLSLLCLLPAGASAQAVVAIENASALPNETTTTNVIAYNVTNLGNFGITVTYDPGVVNITDVTEGPDVGNFRWERISDGKVRLYTMNMFEIPSLSGDVTLATLTLRAVGDLGDTCSLNLEIGQLLDNESNPIPAISKNGTFKIVDTEPPLIEFIAPTPENGTKINVSYVNITVNVADPSGVSVVLLNWNGVNETMSMIANNTWSINKTNLSDGVYTFKVYANDTAGNLGVSETRIVIVSVLPRIGDMNGDGEVNFDDVIALAKHIYFGTPVYDDPDVNGDGEVNFDDVIALAKHIYFGTPIYP